jgi:AAA domain
MSSGEERGGGLTAEEREALITSAAGRLATGLDVHRELESGVAVPRRRLRAEVLGAIGEPLEGAHLVLDMELALRVEAALGDGAGQNGIPEPGTGERLEGLRVATLEEFVEKEEPGAEAVLGTKEAALIPEGSNVMVYGAGGAGKTTLCIDLGFHLAGGDDWLTVKVSKAVSVLVVENEGPRPMFRVKLRRKRDGWVGSEIEDRLRVLEDPWGRLNLDEESWREWLAWEILTWGIDVCIIGPVTSSGMEAAGTLQEVRDFVRLVDDVRRRSGRRVAFVLVHHENRAGQVSGQWEPAVETLLHVTGEGHGKLRLHFQKARGSSEHHGTTKHLRWADGDGFELEESPVLGDEEIEELLTAAVAANPGSTWSKVEDVTQGAGKDRLVAARDRLLAAGAIVNVVKQDGREVALDHLEGRKRARLHLRSDPTIRYLTPEPGLVAGQFGPPGGESGKGQLTPAPLPLVEGQGVRASFHTPDEAAAEEVERLRELSIETNTDAAESGGEEDA